MSDTFKALLSCRFHGIMSRDDADLLLTADEDEDGRYLIRESQRAKEQYTLAIRSAFSAD